MSIKRKVFASVKPGLSQSSELNSSFNINNALENNRKRMGQFFKGNQILGRKGTISCVSLEITALAAMALHICFTLLASLKLLRGIEVKNCGCFGVF
jgi:hypothetical protein